MRPPELPRRLLDRQPLEVAQNDRQTERYRQSPISPCSAFGVLAGYDRLLGRRDRRLDRRFEPARSWRRFLILASATEPHPGTPGRSERDAIEPVAQPVAVPDRAGLPGQHQERGLEGVFRQVLVIEELAADAQHHRPVPPTSAAKAASPAASRR